MQEHLPKVLVVGGIVLVAAAVFIHWAFVIGAAMLFVMSATIRAGGEN